jgi:hypothetical protein
MIEDKNRVDNYIFEFMKINPEILKLSDDQSIGVYEKKLDD